MMTHAAPPVPQLGEPFAPYEGELDRPLSLSLGPIEQLRWFERPEGRLVVACRADRVEAIGFPFQSAWQQALLGDGHVAAVRALEARQQLRVLVGEGGWLLATTACPAHTVAAVASLLS